jgi:hypothetical protein
MKPLNRFYLKYKGRKLAIRSKSLTVIKIPFSLFRSAFTAKNA